MSITMERAPDREWEAKRRPQHGRPNLGKGERLLSAAVGGALIAAGLIQPRRWWAHPVGAALMYRAVTGSCPVCRALGINRAVAHSDQASVRAQHGVHFERSLTIDRPAEEIFYFWRCMENLPRLIDHLTEVTSTDDRRSHWVAEGPFGVRIEWDAEILEERPNELLAWRSLEGSQVDTAGSLHLRPLGYDRGTAVRLNMKYDPPGGRLGAAFSDWMGVDAERDLFEGLRRMKRLLEAGEIATTDDQPRGTCTGCSGAGREA